MFINFVVTWLHRWVASRAQWVMGQFCVGQWVMGHCPGPIANRQSLWKWE